MVYEKQMHGRSLPHRTGGRARIKRKHGWAIWLLPVIGLVSLVWFLIRVVPKPSRAAYPCQRVAAPLAGGFVVWSVGLITSTLIYRKARALCSQSRYVLAGVLLAIAVLVVWLATGFIDEGNTATAFVPTDPPNTPIGLGKGIHPGRVVWVHEPNATNWDGQTGSWWDDENTDPIQVDLMVSQAIRSLTGERSEAAAWDALFRHFNRVHGRGDVGYRQGEKIAIKINMNQDTKSSQTWRPDAGMPSPQMIHSLLKQLIDVVGVSGRDITVYDASKYIGDPIYDKVRANPDPEFQRIRFVVVYWEGVNGREAVRMDPKGIVHFSDPEVLAGAGMYLPLCVTEATYLINLALLRAHQYFGVTLTAKNHFGSIRLRTTGGGGPDGLHSFGYRDRPMTSYNCLVDLIGHKHLGGKTLLFMIDALYPAENQMGPVIRFSSFGNDWCSSLFVSEDPVAIDSVGLDFLRDEPNSRYVQISQNLDNYLHEAALAHDPASGVFYDPEGDGTRLASLGVHEHWNNPVDRQYSRNLGLGEGIELLAVRLTEHDAVDGRQADLTDDGVVDARDLTVFLQAWLTNSDDPQWTVPSDLAPDDHIDFYDWAWLSRYWGWEADGAEW